MAIPEGWESLAIKEQQETDEQRQQRLQLGKDFVATFSTDHGQRVLEHFKSYTLNQPSWIPGYTEGQGQWREGQNSIIRSIEHRISAKNTEG